MGDDTRYVKTDGGIGGTMFWLSVVALRALTWLVPFLVEWMGCITPQKYMTKLKTAVCSEPQTYHLKSETVPRIQS